MDPFPRAWIGIAPASPLSKRATWPLSSTANQSVSIECAAGKSSALIGAAAIVGGHGVVGGHHHDLDARTVGALKAVTALVIALAGHAHVEGSADLPIETGAIGGIAGDALPILAVDLAIAVVAVEVGGADRVTACP
jgi:hypothetical protein